jgi:peroxiredoxin
VGFNFGVGREAPTFTLPAAGGGEIALEQYRRDWLPVLAFVPAAGAGDALARLGTAAGALWGLRGQLIGVCVAGVDEVGELVAQAGGIEFPVLADGGAVARAYGACRPDGELREMAFIVDRAGKIVWSAEGPDALLPATILTAFRQVVR